MDTKRFFLYFIVITALALAGCGGNGGGGIPPVTDMCPTGQVGTYPDCMDPEPTVNDVTVPMLPMGYDSNPAGMQTVDAGDDWTNGDVTYSCPAGGAACEIEVMADGRTVTSTGGAATAARSAASIAQQTADEDAARMAAVAAATKAAGTKRTAIAAEAEQGTDAGIGGSADDGSAVTTYSLSIKRDRMATTVEIADTALAGDDDPKFMQAMDLGGGTTMHVRAMDADDDGNVVEEVVMVTTDIEAPKAVEFEKFQLVEVPADQSSTTTTTPQELDVNPKTAGGSDFQSLNIASGGTAETGIILAQIMGPPAAAVEGGSQTTPYTDVTATQDVNERRFTGTYNGADGTFVCTTAGGTACSATTNNKGEVTALVGDWNFTPAMGATSDQPDYDYLSYGFWLKRTTDKDGVLTYNEVETFARSSAQLSGSVASVTGTATYSGGATGVYVRSVTNSDGTEASATSGHFTATAELTATFAQVNNDAGQGTIAPSMLNTLTGTISDYQLSGGEANNWMTVLAGAIVPSTGTVDAAATNTAKGGSPTNDGSFTATFHGDVTATGTPAVVPKPSSVVGEFNSFFTDGSVAGGFGARLDP